VAACLGTTLPSFGGRTVTDDTIISEGLRSPERPDIPLPDGEVLKPRKRFGRENLDVCDKTVQRYNLPTTYIGGVAYVKQNASLQILADKATRRNQPQKRRSSSRVA
jgi:hypothetical protein